jgi:hypothetical protein
MRTQRLETWSNLVSLGTRFQEEWSIGEFWTGYSLSNMWQLKRLHPNILKAWTHELGARDLLQ